MNVFEAVLHQQECGRNLRRSRVLELLCPEAPRLAVLWLQGSPDPALPSPACLRAPRLPGPRAFRLPLSATATLPERSQTEWV